MLCGMCLHLYGDVTWLFIEISDSGSVKLIGSHTMDPHHGTRTVAYSSLVHPAKSLTDAPPNRWYEGEAERQAVLTCSTTSIKNLSPNATSTSRSCTTLTANNKMIAEISCSLI